VSSKIFFRSTFRSIYWTHARQSDLLSGLLDRLRDSVPNNAVSPLKPPCCGYAQISRRQQIRDVLHCWAWLTCPPLLTASITPSWCNAGRQSTSEWLVWCLTGSNRSYVRPYSADQKLLN